MFANHKNERGLSWLPVSDGAKECAKWLLDNVGYEAAFLQEYLSYWIGITEAEANDAMGELLRVGFVVSNHLLVDGQETFALNVAYEVMTRRKTKPSLVVIRGGKV